MESPRFLTIARNFLLCVGAYYLSEWLVVPLALGFAKLTQGLTYVGEFNGKIVLPLILHFPLALVAFAAGAAVVSLVESSSPVHWVVFPAIFYGLFSFLGHHWAHTPALLDRVGQTLAALFPAITCVMGALVTTRRNVGVAPD